MDKYFQKMYWYNNFPNLSILYYILNNSIKCYLNYICINELMIILRVFILYF